MSNGFLNELKRTPENKIRRKFYELMLNIDVIDFNKLYNWKEILIFIFSESKYVRSQGLEHLFLNLMTSELSEGDIDFINELVITHIDEINPHIFYSISDLFKKNLSEKKMSFLKNELFSSKSKNASVLLKFFE